MTHEQEEVMAFVTEWYDLATRGRQLPDNAYFRFLALWIAFNGFCSLTFPNAQTDAAQVRSFGSWAKDKKSHVDALAGQNYRAAVGVLEVKGVFNYLKNEMDQITDVRDIKQVISLVYRVRCNLFHARKVPANLRDRKLVEASYVIVSELLKRLGEVRHANATAV